MNPCYGEQLITLGTAIAFRIAQDKCADDLVILSALFNVIGDELGLLASFRPPCNNSQTNAEEVHPNNSFFE